MLQHWCAHPAAAARVCFVPKQFFKIATLRCCCKVSHAYLIFGWYNNAHHIQCNTFHFGAGLQFCLQSFQIYLALVMQICKNVSHKTSACFGNFFRFVEVVVVSIGKSGNQGKLLNEINIFCNMKNRN